MALAAVLHPLFLNLSQRLRGLFWDEPIFKPEKRRTEGMAAGIVLYHRDRLSLRYRHRKFPQKTTMAPARFGNHALSIPNRGPGFLITGPIYHAAGIGHGCAPGTRRRQAGDGNASRSTDGRDLDRAGSFRMDRFCRKHYA
jgi:hypothetical protein